MRREIDALGEMMLPDEVYYGIQTERGRQNAISGQTIGDYQLFIWAIAAIKRAAALANRDVGALDPRVAGAIAEAAAEVMEGKFAGQFPLDLFQGGGYTSSNMNVNEVVANRANEMLTGHKGYDLVHPNTHVNMGQSTNDVIPSAMKIAFHVELKELAGALRILEHAFATKEKEFADVVKVARTCMQDAVPITLGQEFSGYLAFLRRQVAKLHQVAEQCLSLPLGATAVGTGLGAFPGYVKAVYGYLRDFTGLSVSKDENFFDGLQNGDVYLSISSVLKELATGLAKIASDLRVLSSGPRAGLNEIQLPAVQPGSSIMPGKVNPVIPELVKQVCYQVCGNDLAITMAVEAGELDLNIWEPVVTKCVHESCALLSRCIPIFAEKCVLGIGANRDVCRKYAESSIALSVVVASAFDYETGSRVARIASSRGITVRDACIELGLLRSDEADKYLDPMALTDPAKSNELIAELRREKCRRGC